MKKGIDSIDIRNFRGIENLKLEDLKRINILVGENNSGKTTVLEAVSFFHRPFDMVSHLQRISRKFGYRGSYYRKIKEMFNQNNLENPVDMKIGVNGKIEDIKIHRSEEKVLGNPVSFCTKLKYSFRGESRAYTVDSVKSDISVDSNQMQFINMTYSNPLTYLVEDYSLEAIDEAIKSGNKAEITKILKIFDENISDFNYISSEEEIYITTDDERASMSISNYGDGLKKALVLISKIIESKDGIALIDELETGIHKEVIGKLFNQIIEKSDKYNAQIIATTHSREAVESLLENLEDNLDEIAIFRLESFNNRFYARRFSGEKAYDIIVENGGDLR